jgi:hypothetical protein
MRVHDVARRDVCRWIARCHGLAGAIDAGLLGIHQQLRLVLCTYSRVDIITVESSYGEFIGDWLAASIAFQGVNSAFDSALSSMIDSYSECDIHLRDSFP